MPKLSLRDLDVSEKEVLMRVDFNVPLKDGAITDDTRITAALGSIKHLLDGGAKLVLCSHLGRPKGERNPEFSLKPVAARLGELLGQEVAFSDDCIGEASAQARSGLSAGQVLLLENTRFYKEETENDSSFAKDLAGSAEIFVNDAFGTAHRAHASTEGVTHHVSQSAMGFLIERELDFLDGKLAEPERPFLVIMGGAKVSDKIEVITALLDKADAFIIGGAMAYTFRLAQGHKVGKSLVEPDKTDLALSILEEAEKKNTRFLLPADTLVTQEFKNGAETRNTAPYADGGSIDDEWEGIDIGEKAIAEFSEEVARAKTILWNGPMGVFEIDSFAAGTKAIAAEIAKSDALTIVGGGDSVTAARKFGIEEQLSFMSTGGGASLELLEGKTLPGVAALTEV